MIQVRYLGRFGNNLFQYAFGYRLHRGLGFALEPHPPRVGGWRRVLHRLLGRPLLVPDWTGPEYDRLRPLPGARHAGPEQVLKGHQVDLPALLADPTPRRIVLEGFFQRLEYYRDHKAEFATMFRLDPPPGAAAPEADNLVCHIRGGDLRTRPIPNQPPLPESYFARIIETEPHRRLYLVAESADDPVAVSLARRYGGRIVSGAVAADYAFLLRAEKLALSVSTLGWWAAWLSEASRVHFPVAAQWDPAIRPEVDLRVDEPRYEYHRVELRAESGEGR